MTALVLALGAASPGHSGIRVNNVIQVAADGDHVANCLRLLAVLDAIDDSSSANPYVVLLEPATFSCGTTSVVVPEHVSLQGAGPGRTEILGSIDNLFLGVVHLFHGSQLRGVTVRNELSGASDGAIVVSSFTLGGSVSGVELHEVELRPPQFSPRNYAIFASSAQLAVYRSTLIFVGDPMVYAEASSHLSFHYSSLEDVVAVGGSDIDCFFSWSQNTGDPLSSSCL